MELNNNYKDACNHIERLEGQLKFIDDLKDKQVCFFITFTTLSSLSLIALALYSSQLHLAHVIQRVIVYYKEG